MYNAFSLNLVAQLVEQWKHLVQNNFQKLHLILKAVLWNPTFLPAVAVKYIHVEYYCIAPLLFKIGTFYVPTEVESGFGILSQNWDCLA